MSRAITMSAMGNFYPDEPPGPAANYAMREANLQLIGHTGAKFIGRVAGNWGEWQNEQRFKTAQETAGLIHALDPEAIVQASIYEYIHKNLLGPAGDATLRLPGWVQQEFGVDNPPAERAFDFYAMLYNPNSSATPELDAVNMPFPDGGNSPDITKPETQMYFYYRATRYIDAGFEAIHFGQIHRMNLADTSASGVISNQQWWNLLNKVRSYAAKRARRGVVVLDAHTHGVYYNQTDQLLFDFHSAPLRIKQRRGNSYKASIDRNYCSAIYGQSKGGITPMGERLNSLPYLVEFDNYGLGQPGEHCRVYGLDEISWFGGEISVNGYRSLRTADERNRWLVYAAARVKQLDPNAYLQMPGYRVMTLPDSADPDKIVYVYYQAGAAEKGQQETIKTIWQNGSRPGFFRRLGWRLF